MNIKLTQFVAVCLTLEVDFQLIIGGILQALIHGLNRHYYSIAINYRKNELEEKMLLNLHKKKWTDGLSLQRFDTHSRTNEQTVQVSEISLVLEFILLLSKAALLCIFW